jgi:hypothetical protein
MVSQEWKFTYNEAGENLSHVSRGSLSMVEVHTKVIFSHSAQPTKNTLPIVKVFEQVWNRKGRNR